MEMLRRSSVFAAEVMEVFDRSPTDKELVSQAKALCRDFIHSRLNRAGIGWHKPEHGLSASGGPLGEISSVLLWLGVTWGKVVSLYAVAGALAVDCVRHGHPAMVHTIVDCIGEFVRKSLTSWLKRRGGWVDVTKCVVNTDPSFRSHWLVSAVCAFGHYLKAVVSYVLREK
ncbi:bcl-2-related ovarian killer protein homolog A isoform X3 [Lampris incognitus]|uniref:bcl-2-related ovarian killer protein homolog A isoform X3 n=1 Tax=Lampris incognitus TaxID=2546036 RepID=UPI0024B4B16A|nr:bcl-2-related ovarian killer protein homolog A isoform X3 [Lampris incognitus]